MLIRTYSELRRLKTLEDRYNYLKLTGVVGEPTFGFDRYINQAFYRSTQWKQIRQHIIARDLGCDLGVDGFEIHAHLLIHHMNPMAAIDIVNGGSNILDPEYLITTTLKTHNAIHYGDKNLLPQEFVPRKRGDTKLW
jgi:hypothetical protein